MEDLAPNIYRQRLAIEGIYNIEISPKILKKFMKNIASELDMTIVYGPVVKNLAEQINPVHKGYESIAIWANSGIQCYTWEIQKFFTVDIYTCTPFDSNQAFDYVRDFFKAGEKIHKEEKSRITEFGQNSGLYPSSGSASDKHK